MRFSQVVILATTKNKYLSKNQNFMVLKVILKLAKHFWEFLSDLSRRANEANTFTVERFNITKSLQPLSGSVYVIVSKINAKC